MINLIIFIKDWWVSLPVFEQRGVIGITATILCLWPSIAMAIADMGLIGILGGTILAAYMGGATLLILMGLLASYKAINKFIRHQIEIKRFHPERVKRIWRGEEKFND